MTPRFAAGLAWTLAIPLAFGAGYLTRGSAEMGTTTSHHSSARSAVGESVRTEAAGSEIRSSKERESAQQMSPDESIGARAGKAWRTGSELQRYRAFLGILDEMRAENAPAVFETLMELSQQGIVHRRQWEHFWMRWGELDGAAAMEAFQSAPKKWGDVGQIMWGWGEVNAVEASAWLESHQDLEDFETAVVGITHGHGSRDLKSATALALGASYPGDPLKDRLMEALAEQALRQGTATGVLAWFDSLPGEGDSAEARAAAMRHVYSRLGQSEREQVMVWLQKQSASPWRNDGIIEDMAKKVVQDAPSAALEWVQSLPPSKDGAYTGLRSVVSAWNKKDPAAVRKWIDASPEGEFRKQAAAALAREIAKSQAQG